MQHACAHTHMAHVHVCTHVLALLYIYIVHRMRLQYMQQAVQSSIAHVM